MEKDKMIIEELNSLQERYFDALCTEQEEVRLRQLITLPEAQDERYDALRAVMGYAAVGRRMEFAQRNMGNPTRVRRVALWYRRLAVAAAVVGLAVGSLLLFQRRTDQPAETGNVCYAHVNGEYVTDQEQVQLQMEDALVQMFGE